MTHPAARDIARSVNARIHEAGLDKADVARAAGLTVRQLRRRLHGETAFRAHELLAIERMLPEPAVPAA